MTFLISIKFPNTPAPDRGSMVLRCPLSYRNLKKSCANRELGVDPSTICRRYSIFYQNWTTGQKMQTSTSPKQEGKHKWTRI
jgi:transposase-like protein